jgi:hypothetical protein
MFGLDSAASQVADRANAFCRIVAMLEPFLKSVFILAHDGGPARQENTQLLLPDLP